jgi:hypothetical protein
MPPSGPGRLADTLPWEALSRLAKSSGAVQPVPFDDVVGSRVPIAVERMRMRVAFVSMQLHRLLPECSTCYQTMDRDCHYCSTDYGLGPEVHARRLPKDICVSWQKTYAGER